MKSKLVVFKYFGWFLLVFIIGFGQVSQARSGAEDCFDLSMNLSEDCFSDELSEDSFGLSSLNSIITSLEGMENETVQVPVSQTYSNQQSQPVNTNTINTNQVVVSNASASNFLLAQANNNANVTSSQNVASNNGVLAGTSPITLITEDGATFSGYVGTGGEVVDIYFEYGLSSDDLNEITTIRSVSQSGVVSQRVSGLEQGRTYYVRFCAESAFGSDCGVILSFRTKSLQTGPVETSTGEGASSTTNNNSANVPNSVNTDVAFVEVLVPVVSDFMSLGIQNGVSAMQTGDIITYEVNYKNTSQRNLQDGILYVDLPRDLVYLDSTRGEYSEVDHAISYEFGIIGQEDKGIIFITMQVPELEDSRVPVVASASLVHENPDNGAREVASAYDVDTRYHNLQEELNASLAASVFGSGGNSTLAIVLLTVLAMLLLFWFLQLNGYLSPKVQPAYGYVKPIPNNTYQPRQYAQAYSNSSVTKPKPTEVYTEQAGSPVFDSYKEPVSFTSSPALVDDIYSFENKTSSDDEEYMGHLGV